MRLFLFFFGLALGAVPPSDANPVKRESGTCPEHWSSFNGRCYKHISTHLSWADAELNCRSEGANLVSIHSPQEHEYVKSLIKSHDRYMGLHWIGLSDLHKEGNWMWSDGCTMNFVFWSGGEPNNDRGAEDCVHTNFGPDLKWNDGRCFETYPSVCTTRNTCPN